MDWVKEKIPVESVLGMAPWLTLLFGLAILEVFFTYTKTSNNWYPGTLEPNTMYVIAKDTRFCAGDMGRFRTPERSLTYSRPVLALAGQSFVLTNTGFEVDGKTRRVSIAWYVAAQARMAGRSEIKLPADTVLFFNSEFDPNDDVNNWPFEIVANTDIRGRFTHILLSQNITRIGEFVGSTEPDCKR